MELQNADLYIIHAGEKKEHLESQLDMLLEKMNFDPVRTHVRWEEGDPATKVAEVCRAEQIDLLIAGALKQQNLLQYYLGSVTRKILRSATCSVLVLREPGNKPSPVKEVLVCADENPRTAALLAHAVAIGRLFRSRKVRILKQVVFNSGKPARGESREGMREAINSELAKVAEMLKFSETRGINIRIKLTSEDPARNPAEYARKYKADLLLIPAPSPRFMLFSRMLRRETEYLLTDLPCNLLLLKDRAMIR